MKYRLEKPSLTSIASSGLGAVTNFASNYSSDKLFDDTDIGRTMGTLFSSGISSTGNTMSQNLLKGTTLTKGLGINAASSLAGAGAGIAANYIGQGLSSSMGNSALGRGVGQGVSTGLGTIGGAAASNLVNTGKIGNLFKGASAINPYALGANIIGSAMGAAKGPSKEYGGKYGNITSTMDTVYDGLTAAANFIPGAGQIISGAMVLNKGLSNIFGSTDWMTKTDSILGSAFMPAPVNWLNMAKASKTGTFND